jgi:GTP-dependent phosphoenolpyruvate carboxykinase
MSAAQFDALTRLEPEAWQAEINSRAAWFKSLQPRLPETLACIQRILEGEFE